MKGKIIAIVVLLVIASAIVYYMLKGNSTKANSDGVTSGGGTDDGTGGNNTELGTVSKYDIMLQAKVIECGPWSKYAGDTITDGPGYKKPGATRIWMNGCVYPIGTAIDGGIGAYGTKPKL